MHTKLRYKPGTNKLLHPIIKFNGGRGAILCHKCRKIIKENLSWDEFRGKTDLLFCYECAMEVVMKIFKKVENEKTSL